MYHEKSCLTPGVARQAPYIKAAYCCQSSIVLKWAGGLDLGFSVRFMDFWGYVDYASRGIEYLDGDLT
jgi:hypothetical protein